MSVLKILVIVLCVKRGYKMVNNMEKLIPKQIKHNRKIMKMIVESKKIQKYYENKNNDIKEILSIIEKVANKEIASRNALMEMKAKDYHQLLDFIINLQEENKHLDEVNCKLRRNIEKLKNTNKNLKEELILMVKDDEKSQETIIKQAEIKNKAIKYLKEYCIDDEFYINLTNKEKNIIEVLNILEGSDKDSNDRY